MAGIQEPLLPVPGFSAMGANIGIKDDRMDFGVVHSSVPCTAAGVFTRNNFPGAPVIVGREHLADGRLQTVVVNSKNANVATGPDGERDSRRICAMLGETLGIDPALVLPSSTGVIGVRLPLEKILNACGAVPAQLATHREGLEDFARAIMTTDSRPKAISVRMGKATLTGIAKGSGMIEPNMATMLAYLFTDASLPPDTLRDALKPAVESSFNRISVDTDTSTSDTVVVMANGLAGPVPPPEFQEALNVAARYLAREIARDGEGATKLIELHVEGAASPEAALAIAKSVINSPLVKTAIYGADPNWGRFVMAVGKAFDYPVALDDLRIAFGAEPGALEISAASQSDAVLEAVSAYLRGSEISIRLTIGRGAFAETVWGCDLTEDYVRGNADYTT